MSGTDNVVSEYQSSILYKTYHTLKTERQFLFRPELTKLKCKIMFHPKVLVLLQNAMYTDSYKQFTYIYESFNKISSLELVWLSGHDEGLSIIFHC